jgi:CHAP domain
VQTRDDRDPVDLEKTRRKLQARSTSQPGPVGSGSAKRPGPHTVHTTVIFGFVLALIAAITVIVHLTSHGSPRAAAAAADDPSPIGPYGSLGQRVAAMAESQLGYRTDPSDTYCNKYSAYFGSGTADCGNSNLDEEWCADFAAWVWLKSGALVTYQFINGDINSSAASFYEWGVQHGTWHSVESRYTPRPGDVAVYGLNPSTLVASHVAVVIGYHRGDRGPDVVNGDGDKTGFSVVELETDQYEADAPGSVAYLSGYTSPTPAG